MLKNKNIAVAVLATSIIGFAGATASAQNNPNFRNGEGELILGFQGVDSLAATASVLVNLGETTSYRDATGNLMNIVNIGALLTSTYGANWFDNDDLFFGLGGSWSNANPPDALNDGDPQITNYLSKPRTAVGNEMIKNSTMNTPTSANQIAGANALVGLANTFEGQSVLGADTFAKSLANNWEDFNVTSAAGVQSTAFGITGGIQQRFLAGSVGTYSNGAAEGALDLYRLQQVNTISGQFDEGGPIRVPNFEGIFTINQAGDVSFIAPVPEPSSALLLGGATVLGMALRRRRTVAA